MVCKNLLAISSSQVLKAGAHLMEMEGIHGNAYIISVYCFYHIIGCSKLVDGAVRCTTELQGDLHIRANLIGKITKTCNCFFFDLTDRFVFYIKAWNGDQHFHSDRFGNLQDKINFFVNLFFPCLISLVKEDQSVGSIGEVLLGKAPGRTADDEITIFDALGLAIEDVASAKYVYERATL